MASCVTTSPRRRNSPSPARPQKARRRRDPTPANERVVKTCHISYRRGGHQFFRAPVTGSPPPHADRCRIGQREQRAPAAGACPPVPGAAPATATCWRDNQRRAIAVEASSSCSCATSTSRSDSAATLLRDGLAVCGRTTPHLLARMDVRRAQRVHPAAGRLLAGAGGWSRADLHRCGRWTIARLFTIPAATAARGW